MIYSVEECGIILKILKRKELERTIFTTLETLPLSFRLAMDCQLSLDIKRCEAMQRLSVNEFAAIESDLEVLAPQPMQLEMDLYQEYLSSLGEEDMMTESGFTFYCNLGMDLYMRMTRAKGYAKDILDGQPPVSYEDFMKFTKMKGLFTVAKEHCEPLVDFEDLPYAEANDYIDCMLDECSIMMRLHLSKPVGVDELCGHVDRRKMVSVDDFNKICLPDYDPRDRGDIVSFENKMQYRTDILYAMILVSAEMGLYGYD